MSEDYMAHYGVKGMRWGVRKSRKSNGTRRTTSKRSATKRDTKRAVKNAFSTLGPIAVSALMIGANLAVISGGTKTSVPTQSYIDFGKSFTADYLKTNGTKIYSQVKKEVDRSDWTWADYAWAEVEG